MPLFGRKHDKMYAKGNNRQADTERYPEYESGCEAEGDRLRRQLDSERQQRIEDVHKERAERIAAQDEQRRLQKENARLIREAGDLRLRLETERSRARRKGFFGGALFSDKSAERCDER